MTPSPAVRETTAPGTAVRKTAVREAAVRKNAVRKNAVRETAVREAAPGRARRRPRDQYGLALTTGSGAAAAYRTGLDRLLSVEDGAAEALGEAVRLDPQFALGRAALAIVLTEQAGAPATADRETVRAHLHEARRWSHLATEREASFVTAAVLWCAEGLSGDALLVGHVRRWPRDACAVSLIAPSIASAGVSAGVVDVWPLLDGIRRHYPGDWWLTGLRAFARTEQGRWGEAESLAAAGLDARPGSGHAAHALAHVLYETGRHEAAIDWLDDWRAGAGARQRFGCHFSWHAALCELGLGRIDDVRRRFDRDLGSLTGSRALVDGGSLLARCAAHGHPLGGRRAAAVREAAGGLIEAPASPFFAWHAAVLAGLCADVGRLDALEDHARRRRTPIAGGPEPSPPCLEAWGMVVSVCRAVRAALRSDHLAAAALISALGDTVALGGSPAQRELLDDIVLGSLVAAGESEAAAAVAARRLRRRPSEFDRRLCRPDRVPAPG
jgi:hypothetical protein